MGDAVRESASVGRYKKLTLRGLKKEVEQDMTHVTQGYEEYVNWGNATGSIALANLSTTAATGVLEVPMHFWELTCSRNVVNAAQVFPNMRVRPQFTTPLSTGQISFSTDKQLNVFDNEFDATKVNGMPQGQGILKSSNIKLLFYAATKLPCRFTVQLVQFKDQRLCPENGLATAANEPFMRSVYQSYVKPYTANPIEQGLRGTNAYLKVIKQVDFIMDPKESTDNSTLKTHQVNMFYKHDKNVNFNWKKSAVEGVINFGVNATAVSTDVDMQLNPHWRSRVFLLIRCQAANAAAYDPQFHPTYDISIKNKWMFDS